MDSPRESEESVFVCVCVCDEFCYLLSIFRPFRGILEYVEAAATHSMPPESARYTLLVILISLLKI